MAEREDHWSQDLLADLRRRGWTVTLLDPLTVGGSDNGTGVGSALFAIATGGEGGEIHMTWYRVTPAAARGEGGVGVPWSA